MQAQTHSDSQRTTVIHSNSVESSDPEQIFTTRGLMEICLLEKKTIISDEEDVTVTATEYWIDGEIVRRDVNLALKPKNILNLEAQEL